MPTEVPQILEAPEGPPIPAPDSPPNEVGLEGLEDAVVAFIGNAEIVTSLFMWGVIAFALWLFRKELRRILWELAARAWKVKAPGGVEVDSGAPVALPPPEEELRPDALLAQPPDADAGAAPAVESTAQDDAVPQADSLELAKFLAMRGEVVESDAMFDRVQSEESDSRAKVVMETDYLRWKYFFASPEEEILDRLGELAGEGSARSVVLRVLGDCLDHGDRVDQARARYEEAIEAAEDDAERAHAAVRQARMLIKGGDFDEARRSLQGALRLDVQDDRRLLAWKALADVEKAAGNKKLAAMVFEKVIEATPTDTSELFDAAFAQSEGTMRLLALRNYDALLKYDSDNVGGSNNLGVICGQLGLPVLAVEHYQRASDLGGTISTANLANKLLQAGFVNEAIDRLKGAQGADDPDESVAARMNEAQEARAAEAEKLDASLGAARDQREFVRNYIDGYYGLVPAADSLGGRWSFDKVGDATFEALEPDQSPSTGGQSFATIALLLPDLDGMRAGWPSRARITVKFVSGRAADVQLWTWDQEGSGTGIAAALGKWSGSSRGLGVLSEDGSQIFVMIESYNSDPVYHTISRLDSNEAHS